MNNIPEEVYLCILMSKHQFITLEAMNLETAFAVDPFKIMIKLSDAPFMVS